MMMKFTQWRTAAAVLVCAALMAPAVSAQGRKPRNSWSGSDDQGPKETETVEKTVSIPSSGTLRLRNFSGDIHVTGTSGRDISLKARRRAGRDQLDHIKLDIHTSGSVVTIYANKKDDEWERNHHNNNVVETTFDLEVPASVRLDIDAFSSDVTIEGMATEPSLKTFSGNLTVRDLKGGINAETFSGDITVMVAPNARGNVSFNTFSGDLDSKLSISSSSRRKRTIEGTLPGGSGPSFNFKTFSGDVSIKSR